MLAGTGPPTLQVPLATPGAPRLAPPRPALARPLRAAPGRPAVPPQRHVWHSRFGTIVIEVIGADCYVNGQRVEPAPPGTV